MPTYFLGTDEAGYGPNLGPMVVTATAWRVPDANEAPDLYALLADLVTRPGPRSRSARRGTDDDDPLEIGDSKQLYSAGSDLGRLELGVWAMFSARNSLPTDWAEAWEALAPGSRAVLERHPWHQVPASPFPRAVTSARIVHTARRLAERWETSRLELITMRSRAVFPEQWNQLLDRWQGKAEVLSHVTLDLIRQVLAELAAGAVIIQCDKHGGRNRYGPLLQVVFPDDWLEVVCESRELSHYRSGTGDSRREFYFRMGGEEQLPVALASMASKYLRELAMQSLNDFWCSRIPGLRPTAGYPVDARRFYREIAPLQQQMQIPDHLLWRRK